MEDDQRSSAKRRTTEMPAKPEGTDYTSPATGASTSPLLVGDTRPSAESQDVSATAVVSPLDMSNVAAALPEYMYRQMPPTMYQQPHSYPVQQNSPVIYPYQGAQYTGPMHGNFPMTYATQIHPQGFPPQRGYGHFPVSSTMGAGQQVFQGQPFYPQHAAMPPTMQGGFPQAQQPQTYGQPQGMHYSTRAPVAYHGAQIRVDNFGSATTGGQSYSPNDAQGIRRTSSANSLKVSAALRGPPRKPRQSGHALWVGNLPPGTNIIDLKDHFSRDATEDIESVFLISKSNCAFVNYRTDESCTAAMGRFHDSRFNGVRLVCRLRRGSSPTSATPPASAQSGSAADSKLELLSASSQTATQDEDEEGEDERTERDEPRSRVKERYFIIKSLTIEDLERSVVNGIWATQSHNEEALNRAYQLKTAENVYLIFSANKSGEYFGYARMDSAIDSDLAASIDISLPEPQPQKMQPGSSMPELPLTIPTPATVTAPRGYIIDDSARGTIFWEAESVTSQADLAVGGLSPANTESENASGEEMSESRPKSPTSASSANPSSTFGKPFKITWMSTERLPFYRTRGLRNPWNTNREVKIARDGTELEPGVGRKLVGMFNAGLLASRSQQQLPYPSMMAPMHGQGPTYRPY